MFEKILKKLRYNIISKQYIMTLHAEEEMNNDNLSIYDVEYSILNGKIMERQRDRKSGEWKYRLRGQSMYSKEIEVVVKIGVTGKLVIITVYVL